MIPWVLLDAVPIPGSTRELRLLRRGGEYAIRIGTEELMNSRLSGSEEALATLAAADLAQVSAPNVLIGGLGMGFTLRAGLEAFGAKARITVCELVPAVVAWAKGPMADLFGASLTDPRVRVVEADVADLIRAKRSAWDAILLDVDNGPEGMTQAGNDQLYARGGLAAARDALRPGGVLAVWSATPDDAFTQRLKKAGFSVRAERVRASRTGRGATHTIWLAARPGPSHTAHSAAAPITRSPGRRS